MDLIMRNIVQFIVVLISFSSFSQDLHPFIELKNGERIECSEVFLKKNGDIVALSGKDRIKIPAIRIKSALSGQIEYYNSTKHVHLIYLKLYNYKQDTVWTGYHMAGARPFQIVIKSGEYMILTDHTRDGMFKAPDMAVNARENRYNPLGLGTKGPYEEGRYKTGNRYYLVVGKNFITLKAQEWRTAKYLSLIDSYFYHCGDFTKLIEAYKNSDFNTFNVDQMMLDIKLKYYKNCFSN